MVFSRKRIFHSKISHFPSFSFFPLNKEFLCFYGRPPRTVNILVWIMFIGFPNVSSVLQHKCLLVVFLPPSVRYAINTEKTLVISFFLCSYSVRCWAKLFSIFDLSWVLSDNFKENIQHLLIVSHLKKSPRILWLYATKALLVEL